MLRKTFPMILGKHAEDPEISSLLQDHLTTMTDHNSMTFCQLFIFHDFSVTTSFSSLSRVGRVGDFAILNMLFSN